MQFKRSLTVVVTAVFLTSSMTMASAVTSKGSRVLAMDVGPGENETLANALDEAQSIGVTTIPVSVSWADIEPDYLDYQDPDNLFADLIDELDGRGMSVILNLRPIAGACRTLPEDLEARFELPTSTRITWTGTTPRRSFASSTSSTPSTSLRTVSRSSR